MVRARFMVTHRAPAGKSGGSGTGTVPETILEVFNSIAFPQVTAVGTAFAQVAPYGIDPGVGMSTYRSSTRPYPGVPPAETVSV